MACSSSGDHARVRWLLEQGANVNAAQSYGWTSLMEACQKGHLEIVRELLRRGANVNAGTHTGWTSLMDACCEGHLEVARLLLAHHASKATMDRYGRTAYDYTRAPNALAELRALVKP
jgi:ankyrin repeat protein